jgi:hypothetical protein
VPHMLVRWNPSCSHTPGSHTMKAAQVYEGFIGFEERSAFFNLIEQNEGAHPSRETSA